MVKDIESVLSLDISLIGAKLTELRPTGVVFTVPLKPKVVLSSALKLIAEKVFSFIVPTSNLKRELIPPIPTVNVSPSNILVIVPVKVTF